VEKRWSDSTNETQELTPSENTIEGWFQLACQLASKSRLIEAERAMEITLEMNSNLPKAWAILSAIYLSLGRETDAEKAGKMAIAQCAELKMTWPKLRNVILSHGIKKGTDWRSPRRVLLDEEATSLWEDALVILGNTMVQESEKPSHLEETEPLEKKESIEPVREVKQVIEETHKERERLPSISSRKIEGLTIFESTSTQPEMDEKVLKIEEVQSESKRLALPTFSSKKYNAQTTSEENKSKEIPVVTKTPESATSWFRVAEFHLKKANWEEAEKAYRRGLALEPENSEAWTQIGSLLMKKGNYKEAEDALRVATKHSYKNANAWYLLGICLQEQNNWNEALIVLKTACNVDQNRADIWLRLGMSEFHIGQYQDAARSFLRTLRISPENRDGMFYLAMCMERRGNRQHALSLYIKLLNIGDLPADMLERIAGSFERLNRPGEAREARRRAVLARKGGS
jgi:cytochrome c-type biogenesis protein CcmH/NrfG